MNFIFLLSILLSIGFGSAHLAQLLGFNQQQCPPCICNNIASQSQAQSQAQAIGGGGGGGGGG
ncbi:hypothetical protein PENTCL1PPCAC_4165, partial [Pristionchus entomophagus]